MIVNELIKELEKYPWNADVVVPDEDGVPTVIKFIHFDGERVWLCDTNAIADDDCETGSH